MRYTAAEFGLHAHSERSHPRKLRPVARRKRDSEATRQLVLTATFESLLEVGYHKTSTSAVCRRAGVSRGALLHHFPNHETLVVHAVEDVMRRRLEEFSEEFGALQGDTDPREMLQRLWSALRGETYFVWLELAVASRTDAALRREFVQTMQRFDGLVRSTASSLVGSEGGVPREHDIGETVSILMSCMNGIVLDQLHRDARAVDERFEVFRDLLRTNGS